MIKTILKDLDAEKYVIGCLIQQPELLIENRFIQEYFSESFTQILFGSINNMYENGAKDISTQGVCSYLNGFLEQKKIFETNDGFNYLTEAVEDAKDCSNFSYHYERLKKSSFLREMADTGIDISDYFDPNDKNPATIEERQQLYLSSSLSDIMNFYQSWHDAIYSNYSSSETQIYKAGSSIGTQEYIEDCKNGGSWGLPYESEYMTAVTMGSKCGDYYITTAGSGGGKTRTGLAQIAKQYGVQLFNPLLNKWENNPIATSQTGGAIYIQYEMDSKTEIMIILLAYLAAVPQDHITMGIMTEQEEERIQYAFKVFDQSCIFLAEMPEFTIREIKTLTARYVRLHHITAVFFDYIDQCPSLTREYIELNRSGASVRDDIVLKNFSKALKLIAKESGVSMNSCTQAVNTKDSTKTGLEKISNAKSIAFASDFHCLLTRVDGLELEKLQPIIDKLGCKIPTHCREISKNRGNKYNNIKVFTYIDFGTMREEDVFCTNLEYELLPDIPRVKLNYVGDTTVAEITQQKLEFVAKTKKPRKSKEKEEKTGFGGPPPKI